MSYKHVSSSMKQDERINVETILDWQLATTNKWEELQTLQTWKKVQKTNSKTKWEYSYVLQALCFFFASFLRLVRHHLSSLLSSLLRFFPFFASSLLFPSFFFFSGHCVPPQHYNLTWSKVGWSITTQGDNHGKRTLLSALKINLFAIGPEKTFSGPKCLKMHLVALNHQNKV